MKIHEYAVLRFGTVTNIDEQAGRVRVRLAEEGIITPPLAIASAFTQGNQSRFMPALNEQVAVVLDNTFEAGAVIGGIYTKSNTPSSLASGEAGYVFEDGSKVTWRNGEVTVKGAAKVVVEAGTKVELKNAIETLGSILGDLLDAMQAETHLSAAPGSPTGPPINIAAYAAIKARLAALLE